MEDSPIISTAEAIILGFHEHDVVVIEPVMTSSSNDCGLFMTIRKTITFAHGDRLVTRAKSYIRGSTTMIITFYREKNEDKRLRITTVTAIKHCG